MPCWLSLWFIGIIVGVTVGCSLTWKFIWMALSNTIKSSPQGGGIWVSSSSVSSVHEMHGVFSNMDFSSTSRGKPRAIAIVCKILIVSWASLNSSKDFSCLVLRIFLGSWSFALGEGMVSLDKKILF